MRLGWRETARAGRIGRRRIKTRGERTMRWHGWQRRLMSEMLITICALAIAGAARTAEPDEPSAQTTAASASVRIDALVDEAMRQSPLLAAAEKHWQATTRVPRQVSTLPDPQVALQQLTVGSPAPFSGYETSDFYYTGFGISQDIPGPGKLGLRARQAEKESDYAHASLEARRRTVAEQVRETCYELWYLARERELLSATHEQLTQIEQAAEQMYRTGQAPQQDVAKSQLKMTTLIRDLATNREQSDAEQAQLKAILGREVDSPDIAVGTVEAAAFAPDQARVRALAEARSPELKMAQAMEARSADSLALARKDYIPDFNVAYMYQKTGPGLRDYYMLTLGARIPLYFWRKQRPAVEQATDENLSARREVAASRLSAVAEAEREWLSVRSDERVIAMFRGGLIPQARTTRAAALASYQSGKGDFQTLVSAVIDELELSEQYQRTIADHETAIAKLEQIIGDEP
jgi:outer membrane protein, heavy metal efflux system